MQGATLASTMLSTLEGGATMQDTLAGRSPKEQLAIALENFSMADPPKAFAGSYLLINERVSAGQGVVNFGRNRYESTDHPGPSAPAKPDP